MEAHFQTQGYCSVLTQSMGTPRLGIGLQIDRLCACIWERDRGTERFFVCIDCVWEEKNKRDLGSLYQPYIFCFSSVVLFSEVPWWSASEDIRLAGTHTSPVYTNTCMVYTRSYYPIISMISSAEVPISCRAAIQHIGLKQNMLQL